MSHYLDETIKGLLAKAEVTKEVDGALMVRGPYGASRIYKRRVYFFEIGSLKADDAYEYKNKREAMLAGLEWIIKGRV
jgi:hypothetical protein